MSTAPRAPRPKQTYRCKNAGCRSGGSFQDDVEEVWRRKNQSLPTNCHDCREVRKGFTDEDVSCTACGASRRIPRGVKLMHYRNEGPWQAPTYCRRCTEDPDWRRRAERRRRTTSWKPQPDRELQLARSRFVAKADQRVLDMEMDRHGGQPTLVQRISIPTTPSGWQAVPHSRDGNRWNHTFDRPGGGGHATQLRQAFGVSTDIAVLNHLVQLAATTDTSQTIQFRQRDGRIVKYDMSHKVQLVMTREGIPVTAFPRSSYSVAEQIRCGRWQPAR